MLNSNLSASFEHPLPANKWLASRPSFAANHSKNTPHKLNSPPSFPQICQYQMSLGPTGLALIEAITDKRNPERKVGSFINNHILNNKKKPTMFSEGQLIIKNHTTLAPWPKKKRKSNKTGLMVPLINISRVIEHFAYLSRNLDLFTFITMGQSCTIPTALDRSREVFSRGAEISNEVLCEDLLCALQHSPILFQHLIEFGGPYLLAARTTSATTKTKGPSLLTYSVQNCPTLVPLLVQLCPNLTYQPNDEYEFKYQQLEFFYQCCRTDDANTFGSSCLGFFNPLNIINQGFDPNQKLITTRKISLAVGVVIALLLFRLN